MIELLVYLAVLVIVVIVAYWLLGQITLDPKIRQIINIVMVVLIAVIGIGLLLNVAGIGPSLRLR